MIGLALALASSVCWGVSDFAGGLAARRSSLVTVSVITQGAGLVGIATCVALRGHPFPGWAELFPAIVAGGAVAIALPAFLGGLAVGQMSVVAPITATGAAVPVIVGLAEGDRPGRVALVGLGLALAGAIVASRERDELKVSASRRSVLLAAVAAACSGVYLVGLGRAAQHDVLWALLAARTTMVTLLCLGALVLRSAPSADRQSIVALVAIGLLDAAANGLYAAATTQGLLALVAVAASLYPVVTVILARLIIGERLRSVQRIGVLAALLGIVLIASGR